MLNLEKFILHNYIIIKYNSETYSMNMGVFSMLNMMRHNNMMEEQRRASRRRRMELLRRRKEEENKE